MTVAGVRGDEWINQPDERQWIHDGTDWKERPFVDRLAGVGQAAFVNDWSYGGNPWLTIPETQVNFTKRRDDTRIYVEGFIMGFPVGNDFCATWFASHIVGHNVAPGTNPPDPLDVIGYGWFTFKRHRTVMLSGFIKDSESVAAGDHVAELACGTKHHGFEVNSDDYWALRVWEVAP